MKNLFDFATKELSQDAFISWLVSNYDDPKLSDIAYGFINFIAGTNYKDGDFKKLKVLQQANNMDIIIDIWINDGKPLLEKSISDHVIIIEDKTTSSAHSNQLLDYGKKVKEWKNTKKTLVFYKTNVFSEKDKEELNNALRENITWKRYNIDNIYGFFEKVKIDDVIVNFYINHIEKIYNDINKLNTDPTNWNFYNFHCFMNNVIKDKYASILRIDNWIYQGKYASAGLYLKTKKTHRNNENYHVILEIFFRPYEEVFNATIHPEFKYYKDNKYCASWKILDDSIYEVDNKYNMEFQKELLEVFNKSNSEYFKQFKSKQCIATSKNNKDINRFKPYGDVVNGFFKMIDEFINIFSGKI